MQKTQNLQEQFLNQARRDKLAVTMFLMNGFQLRGVIRGFDGFTVDPRFRGQAADDLQARHLHGGARPPHPPGRRKLRERHGLISPCLPPAGGGKGGGCVPAVSCFPPPGEEHIAAGEPAEEKKTGR